MKLLLTSSMELPWIIIRLSWRLFIISFNRFFSSFVIEIYWNISKYIEFLSVIKKNADRIKIAKQMLKIV